MSSKYDDFLNGKPRKSASKNKPNRDLLWNVLTVLMLLLSVGAVFLFFSLANNPASSINPFAPNTLVPPPPTATWTPIGYDATWTPTATLPPTDTSTPRPTYTLLPSATSFKISTATPNYTPTTVMTSTRTPKPTGAPYSINITYNESTTFRPDTSCNSMYVAGQALDSKNTPVRGLMVKLGGSIPGKTFLADRNTTLTGINKVYGESGFEFDLKIGPVASSQGLWIQLYDLSGAPLSEQFKFATFSDCKKNLILIRFQQK